MNLTEGDDASTILDAVISNGLDGHLFVSAGVRADPQRGAVAANVDVTADGSSDGAIILPEWEGILAGTATAELVPSAQIGIVQVRAFDSSGSFIDGRGTAVTVEDIPPTALEMTDRTITTTIQNQVASRG
jgi:hypothetical protein